MKWRPSQLTVKNDIPSGLEPYLCPTDCRLRTDQRAFENAEYDRAQGSVTSRFFRCARVGLG